MKDCALSLCAKLSKPEPNLLKNVCIPVITAWSRPVKSFAQALNEARVIPPIATPIGAIAAADKPDMLTAIFSTIVDAIDLNTMSLANLKANNADKSTISFYCRCDSALDNFPYNLANFAYGTSPVDICNKISDTLPYFLPVCSP